MPTAPSRHPHLITLGNGRNCRQEIYVGNTKPENLKPPAYQYFGEGMVDELGRITPLARDAIRKAVRSSCRGKAQCIVWNPVFCTYLMPDGSTIESTSPPEGDVVRGEITPDIDAVVSAYHTFELPRHAKWQYLCVGLVGDRHVQILSGSPIILADFSALGFNKPGSELQSLFDEEGHLRTPETFRGVKPTGVLDDFKLLGPIQPNGKDQQIVGRWPHAVFEACRHVAGAKLPQTLLQNVWDAVAQIPKASPCATQNT